MRYRNRNKHHIMYIRLLPDQSFRFFHTEGIELHSLFEKQQVFYCYLMCLYMGVIAKPFKRALNINGILSYVISKGVVSGNGNVTDITALRFFISPRQVNV